MKNLMSSKALFLATILAVIVAMPRLGVSDPFTLVSSWTAIGGTQNEPSGFEMTPAMELCEAAGVDMATVQQQGYANVAGYNEYAMAAAPSWSMLEGTISFWDYGSTLSNTGYADWATIYGVSGNPGDSYDVTLNYTYENSRQNLAMDGRSEASSTLNYVWGVLPASNTASAQDVSFGYPFLLMGYALECSYGYQSGCALLQTWGGNGLSYDQNYHFASLSLSDDTQTGSFDLGVVPAGDELFLMSDLTSEADAEMYGPSLVITTEIASSTTDLSTTLIPAPPSTVPEPASITLFVSGLAALAGLRRRKLNR